MAREKQTFRVEVFKDWVNDQLKRTDDFATDRFKAGLCHALEYVLKQCHCYHGYMDNYWGQIGWQQWIEAGEPDFPDKEQFMYGPSGQKYARSYY